MGERGNVLSKKVIILAFALMIIAVTAFLVYDSQKVKLLSSNVFEMNFQREWGIVQKELENVKSGYVIQDFTMMFQKDGELNFMEYQLIGRNPNEFKHYWIRVKPRTDHYLIEGKEINEWPEYERQLPAYEFFRVLNSLDINQLKSAPGTSLTPMPI